MAESDPRPPQGEPAFSVSLTPLPPRLNQLARFQAITALSVKETRSVGRFLLFFYVHQFSQKALKGCVQRVTGHISLPEGVRERETGCDQTRTVLGQQGWEVPLNTGVFSPAWSPSLCTKPLLGHEGRLALTRSQHCNDFVLRTVTGTQSPVTPCWRSISLFLLPPVSLL